MPTVAQPLKKLKAIFEPEGSLPRSQQSACGFYPETDENSITIHSISNIQYLSAKILTGKVQKENS
jgi:hypothetical protein